LISPIPDQAGGFQLFTRQPRRGSAVSAAQPTASASAGRSERPECTGRTLDARPPRERALHRPSRSHHAQRRSPREGWQFRTDISSAAPLSGPGSLRVQRIGDHVIWWRSLLGLCSMAVRRRRHRRACGRILRWPLGAGPRDVGCHPRRAVTRFPLVQRAVVAWLSRRACASWMAGPGASPSSSRNVVRARSYTRMASPTFPCAARVSMSRR
jgi:hypothetical protein